jgi:hypothetical protein
MTNYLSHEDIHILTLIFMIIQFFAYTYLLRRFNALNESCQASDGGKFLSIAKGHEIKLVKLEGYNIVTEDGVIENIQILALVKTLDKNKVSKLDIKSPK